MDNATKLALRVSGIYLLAGSLWILLSDAAILSLITDIRLYAQVQIFKGWFFVLVSALVVFFSLRKWSSLFFQDIADHKQVDKELRRAEKKFHNIFENAPVGIYQATIEGTYRNVNKELVRLLGYESAEELIAASIEYPRAFYVKSGRREEFIERICGEGEVTGFESKMYCKDRTVIWVSENARAIHDQSGTFTGFEGTATEITSRRIAEESLQRLMQAVEQTKDVVLMTDLGGKITYVNPAFEVTYGYSREEAYKNTPRILKSGIQGDAFYSRLWNTILLGQNIRVELINKTKDGQLVTMESTVSPVFDSDTGLSGFIAVQRDVTLERKHDEERNMLERQLFQAQKLESIGTLAGGIAHDFNNVLGIILGYATMLRHAGTDSEKAEKSIDAINNAVQRGADLVRQILMFAREGEVTFASMAVNETVKELQLMIQETFPKTIIVSVNLNPDLPAIRADRTQIHQTLLNLCINARDAMPTGGKLSIGTAMVSIVELRGRVPHAKGSEFVQISVSDTGTGMDEMTQRKIFEPFFTTKELGKGTGLGLAVIYGIVKSHQGYILVQSAPGQGSTFDVYFPVRPDVEVEAHLHGSEEPIMIAGGT